MSPIPHQPGSSTRSGATTTVISVAVASRAATVALMVLGNAVLPTHDAGGVHKFRPRTFPVPSARAGAGTGTGGVFSAFTRWDSAWFLSIADSGYPYPTVGGDDGDGIDCRGTTRAWGGEEYERGEYERLGEDPTEGGDRDETAPSAQTQPRCRPDIPLEEQAHAFFPLYPWVVRWAAAALRALLLTTGLVLNKASSLVLAAVLVSNSCFVASAVLLYRLGAAATGDSLLARRGALAFCVTPASVFFSTAYTESLYAMLSFAGVLVLFSEGHRRTARRGTSSSGGQDRQGTEELHRDASGGSSNAWWGCRSVNTWVAAVLLSLATLARSNGIAGAGVLVLEKLRWMARDVGLFADNGGNQDENSAGLDASFPLAARSPSAAANTQSREMKTWAGSSADGGGGDRAVATAAGHNRNFRRRDGGAVIWLRLAACLVVTALQALLVIAPYVLVQAYAYRKFCLLGAKLAEEGGNGDALNSGGADGSSSLAAELPGLTIEQLHPWCAWKVPSVYAHVQSTYWNVGAFRYFQWKQIPNFLLAAPALILTAHGIAYFFSAQLRSLRATKAEEGCVPSSGSGGNGGGGRNTPGPHRWARGMCFVWRWVLKLADVFFGDPKLPHPAASPFERTGAAALMAQWAFFAFFAAVCMNVQVATRFLAAACPPLHWWTASLLVRDGKGRGGAGEEAAGGAPAALGTCLRWYLGAYFVVGAVLHATFLPWT
ncbi:unnamed protein product [Ectocarpus sp. 13 AM-2016]